MLDLQFLEHLCIYIYIYKVNILFEETEFRFIR